MGYISVSMVAFLVVFALPVVLADDVTPIPADKAQVEPWFTTHVKHFSNRRGKGILDPAVEAAEASRRIITVSKSPKKKKTNHLYRIYSFFESSFRFSHFLFRLLKNKNHMKTGIFVCLFGF